MFISPDEELISKLMKYQYLSVRVGNDCFECDYRFSLSGSTKAINNVMGDYFERLKNDAVYKTEWI